jgi:hypothetical protein
LGIQILSLKGRSTQEFITHTVNPGTAAEARIGGVEKWNRRRADTPPNMCILWEWNQGNKPKVSQQNASNNLSLPAEAGLSTVPDDFFYWSSIFTYA